jgi:hypothetical protein
MEVVFITSYALSMKMSQRRGLEVGLRMDLANLWIPTIGSSGLLLL